MFFYNIDKIYMKEYDVIFDYTMVHTFIPILIISFFLLDSMINRNVKGIVFLIGLAFTVMANIFIMSTFNIKQTESKNKLCNPITLNGSPITLNIPLTNTMLIYTFINLFYTMCVNNFVLQNVVSICILLLLIGNDVAWLKMNSCFTDNHIMINVMVTIIVTIIWSVVIHKSNNKSIIYNLGLKNDATCQIPKKKTMKITDVIRN
mgnify:FL=1